MHVPTIERLLVDISIFMSHGNDFVRKYPRGQFSVLVKSAVMLGVDVEERLCGVLTDLNSIHNQIRRLRNVWLMLLIRSVVIWIAVVCIRIVILQTLDRRAWSFWIRDDHSFQIIAFLLTLALLGVLVNRYFVKGWGPSQQNRLWESFCCYVSMGQGRISCMELRRSLKEIAFAEWRTGMSGDAARRVLLKNRVCAIAEEVDQECRVLATVTAGAELSIFVLGFIGLNLAPFMAWLESASGMN
jgi:hypothetical protein